MSKVLLVYDVSYPHVEGGGQRRLFEIASRLIESGHSVDWLCFKTWNTSENIVWKNGIRFIGLQGYKGLYRTDGGRRRLEPIEFLFALFRSNVVVSGYDIIWTGQWPILHLIWCLFIKLFFKKPVLLVDWWEIWGTTWFRYSWLAGPLGYVLENIFLRLVGLYGHLIFISPKSYNRGIDISKSSKVYLVNNGVDLSLAKSILSPAGKIFDISYLGRLKNHKRVDLLIEAVAIIRDKYSTVVSAIIIGDGPELPALTSQINQLNLCDQIKILDRVSSSIDAFRLIKSSKIFVNPSIKEGGGSISMLEGFSLGLPIVAFRCDDGIDPELVGDGHTGRLVDEVSADALACTIYSLISNPDECNKLSNGALIAAIKYDWDSIAAQYNNLFKIIVRDVV